MARPLTSPASARFVETSFQLVIGVLAFVIPTFARLALDPLLKDQAPYLLHLASVAVAAWIAGAMAGGIALAGSAVAVQILFLGPRNHLLPESLPIAAGEILFLAVGGAGVWLVNRSRRTDRALRDREQQLTYHVDNSPLAVIEWGPDMRVTRWSGGAERLFGWTSPEVVGKRSEDLRWVYEEDAAHVKRVSADLETGANPNRFSLNRNYRKDGSIVWCEWYNSSLLDESGRFTSILSLVLDVTARRQLEEELRAVAAELSQANRLKDEFLATLSHELRTPLHAIVGWSDMLLSGMVTRERQHHAIEVIARNARAQTRLIEDVLDMSRIVTGKLQMSLEPVNVAAVVATAVEGMRPAADMKGVTIASDLQEVTLAADAGRVQQIVFNLLSNAVKFTPAGGRITVTTRRFDTSAELVVADSGVGISPEFLPRVFDRFTQSDASATRQQGGLGLGLAIVRYLAELHGGTVSASSPGPDRGATFTVRIPIKEIEPRVATETPRAHEGAPLDGVKVLVIDDDADTREVVGETLTAAGADVALVADGDEAVTAMAAARFDIVLTDIAMPREDGFVVLERLRRVMGPAAMPPAIALTGYGFALDRRRALEAGFAEHLVKPVSPDTLVDLVQRAARATRLPSA